MKHNDTDLHQKKAICHVPVIFGTRYRDSISLELETQDNTPGPTARPSGDIGPLKSSAHLYHMHNEATEQVSMMGITGPA